MARIVLFTTGGSSVSANTANYFYWGSAYQNNSATESNMQVIMRSAGTVSKLYVRVTSNAITAGNSTVSTRVNAAAGNLIVSIGPTSTGEYEDTTNSDSVSAGDKLNYKGVGGSTGSFITFGPFSTTFDASANTVEKLVVSGSNFSTASQTSFLPLGGRNNGSVTTEAVTQYKARLSGTLKNMYVNILTNSRTTSTTFGSRKNTVAGALTISVSASSTGFFEDTINSDTLAATDLSNYFITTGSGAGTLSEGTIGSEWVNTNNQFVLLAAISSAGAFNTTQQYLYIAGTCANNITESSFTSKLRQAVTLGNASMYVLANTANNTSTTNLRVNGINNFPSLSVPSSSTGLFEDTSHTFGCAIGDEISTATITNTTNASNPTFTLMAYSATSDLSLNVSDTTTVTDTFGRNSYQYARPITIDHTKVGATDSTNFPVLVSGTYAYLATVANSGKVIDASGYDIAFYSDAALTTKLSHEIDSYTAASGTVNFWVKVPTVSHTTDTVIYLAYANAFNVLIEPDRTAVWDSNYLGVYHFGTSASLSLGDSTSNVNSLTNHSTTAASGQIAGASALNGSTQYLDTTNNFTSLGGTNLTVDAWVFTATNSANMMIVEKGPVNTKWSMHYESSFVHVRGNGGVDNNVQAAVPSNSAWHHIVGTWSGTAAKIYIDGSLAASGTLVGALADGAAKVNIGSYDSGTGFFWSGSLDEVRISNVTRSADWITAEYNNQNSPSTFYTVGSDSLQISVSDSTTVSDFPAPSPKNGFQFVRSLTIDHTKVPNTDQTNFPVLVSGTYAYLATIANGGKVYNANSYDIAFYSDAALTTLLNWEIDTYTASSGAVNFWVQIPTVSHTTDTVFYMAYGNANNVLIDQSNRTGTWDSNYKGVWHLPDVTGGASSVKDSTSNANNGTPSNSPTNATGQINGGGNFAAASTQSVDAGSGVSMDVTNSFTMSVWTKLATNTKGVAFSKGTQGTGTNWHIINNPGTGLYFSIFGGTACIFTASPSTNGTTWYHLVATGTANSSNVDIRTYLNGTLANTYTNNSALSSTSGKSLKIGQYADPGAQNLPWDGIIDEARISNTPRSGDWITAEYNNQNSPSTFYTMGAESLSVNVNDTAALAESIIMNEIARPVVNDSSTVTDSVFVNLLTINDSDTTTVTDTPNVALAQQVSVNDTTAVTDSTPVVVESNINKSDTTTVTENLPMMVESYINKSDSSTVSDQPVVAIAQQITVSDTTAVTDNTPLMVENYITKSDSTTVTENVVMMGENSVNTSDTSTVTDNTPVVIEGNISKSDTTAVTDSTPVVVESNINKSDSTTVTDAPQVLLDSNPTVSDTITVTDTPTVQFDLNLTTSDASTVTESVLVSVVNASDLNITVSDTSAVTEFVQVQFEGSLDVSDTSTLSENTIVLIVTSALTIAVSDTTTITEAITLLLSLAASGFMEFFE